jgi:hypothetical protein
VTKFIGLAKAYFSAFLPPIVTENSSLRTYAALAGDGLMPPLVTAEQQNVAPTEGDGFGDCPRLRSPL